MPPLRKFIIRESRPYAYATKAARRETTSAHQFTEQRPESFQHSHCTRRELRSASRTSRWRLFSRPATSTSTNCREFRDSTRNMERRGIRKSKLVLFKFRNRMVERQLAEFRLIRNYIRSRDGRRGRRQGPTEIYLNTPTTRWRRVFIYLECRA